MSWEVLTMRSAKSFFNGAIARSDLRRYWPVLFLYVGLWLIFLPIPVWNRAAERNPALVNLTELCADTYAAAVVLTGYSSEPGQTGTLCFDRDSGESKAVQTPREPQDFSGTGDLFASVLAGGVAKGVPLFQAAQAAADFVRDCIARTLAEGLTEQDGVDFEPLLGQLTSSK